MKSGGIPRAATYIVAGIMLAGFVLILYLFDPLKTAFFPPCIFHHLTGYHCPGCGSMRALHRLFNGNVSGALAMNPLMVISIPFIVILLLRPSWSYRKWVPWSCMAILVIYGVIRNIPAWPFTLLAPH